MGGGGPGGLWVQIRLWSWMEAVSRARSGWSRWHIWGLGLSLTPSLATEVSSLWMEVPGVEPWGQEPQQAPLPLQIQVQQQQMAVAQEELRRGGPSPSPRGTAGPKGVSRGPSAQAPACGAFIALGRSPVRASHAWGPTPSPAPCRGGRPDTPSPAPCRGRRPDTPSLPWSAWSFLRHQGPQTCVHPPRSRCLGPWVPTGARGSGARGEDQDAEGGVCWARHPTDEDCGFQVGSPCLTPNCAVHYSAKQEFLGGNVCFFS